MRTVALLLLVLSGLPAISSLRPALAATCLGAPVRARRIPNHDRSGETPARDVLTRRVVHQDHQAGPSVVEEPADERVEFSVARPPQGDLAEDRGWATASRGPGTRRPSPSRPYGRSGACSDGTGDL